MKRSINYPGSFSFVLALFCFFSLGFKAQKNSLDFLDKKTGELYNQENFDSTLFYAETLLKEAEKNNSVHYQVLAYYYKGLAFYEKNKAEESVQCLYKGLNLCKDTSENKTKALICNRLGTITSDEKDFANAKRYFKEEIVIRKQIGDPLKIAHCLINLSAMHRRLKEIDSSALLLKEVSLIVNGNPNKKLAAYYHNALGAHYRSTKQLDSALLHFDHSYRAWLAIGDKEEALRPLFNAGLIYHLKGDFKKALSNYTAAKNIAEELVLYNQRVTVYGNMAEVYYDLKDFKNSADYFRKYSELNDSLRQNEIASTTLKLDKQYKVERETYKNEIVKQQKEEIEKQTLEIEQQSQRVYLSLLAAIVIASVLIILLIYFGFNKRLNKKLEEAKSKFFSNVVHEIRTPLSMIKAPVAVLKTKLSSPEDQQNIEIAERNIERLNELVTQMLDISKLESAKYAVNNSYGDLSIFFEQVAANYTKIAEEKSITLISDLNLQHKLAIFDKDLLEKITGNLLGNAIKYTESGKQIGINVYNEETEKGIKLVINVWDTGIGISKTEQQTIFDRFYRAQKTSKEVKGAGIGLSLVKDLVDLHHGSIDLTSEESKGSSFTVTLFIKPLETTEILKTKTQVSESTGTYQLLLVEDDKDILDFNAAYLEKNNFKVIKATGGIEALKLLEKNVPDLIVTDLMMPDMDGLTFLKTVKGKQESDHVPFIVLSAKASPQARMEALEAGAQHYLAKPFLPEELLGLINNQLDILNKRKKEFKTAIEEPEKTFEEKFTSPDPYIQKLFSAVQNNYEDSGFSVEKLADLMAINRSHFQRKVKCLTGFSPSEIIRSMRLEKAKELLKSKKGNVTEVAYQTGFSSQSYFTKSFTEYFGVAPSQVMASKN